jgi:hypothetical protein
VQLLKARMDLGNGPPTDFSREPCSVRLRPRLVGSGRPSRHFPYRVFDYRHSAIADCFKGLSDWGGHGRRCAQTNEALDRSLGGHFHASDWLVASLGQQIYLFRYCKVPRR